MRELAITAVGADRPGIVAAITGALLEVGGNLADARAALLGGSFAMVLVVAVPDTVDDDRLNAALDPIAERLDLGLWIGPAEAPRGDGDGDGERCVISVYGADRPGIVNAFSVALAEQGINILDLSSRLVGEPAIYVLGIVAAMPPELARERVGAQLQTLAARSGVECAISFDADEVL